MLSPLQLCDCLGCKNSRVINFLIHTNIHTYIYGRIKLLILLLLLKTETGWSKTLNNGRPANVSFRPVRSHQVAWKEFKGPSARDVGQKSHDIASGIIERCLITISEQRYEQFYHTGLSPLLTKVRPRLYGQAAWQWSRVIVEYYKQFQSFVGRLMISTKNITFKNKLLNC